MGKAKINDLEIAYNIVGSGEPVILIGGYSMVKESWGLQVAGLAKHFQVITFDNRGAGETIYPAGSFTIADMAADTVRFLDFLEIDSANFFGVSMGGLIGQILALDYPDRVKKVALGCTTHGGKYAVQPEKEVMETLGKSAHPEIGTEEGIRMKIPVIFSERFQREEPEKVEEYVRLSLRYPLKPEGAAGQMGALSKFNVKDRLSEIRCPVLVITGSEDKMMPAKNSNLLSERIPGAKLHMVEEMGHVFYLERPEEVNQALIDFFSN